MIELKRSEAEVCRLALDNKCVGDIVDALNLDALTVRKILWALRKKGAAVPKRMPYTQRKKSVPITDLVAARTRINAAGPVWGAHGRIARRFGMNTDTVRARLWKHDRKRQGAAQ